MSSTPFTAQFPREPEEWDEVMLRGTLKENARSFSINFCLKRPDVESSQKGASPPKDASPPYIAYHFKTIYDEEGGSQVIQKSKNGVWSEEEVLDNFWHTDVCEPFTVIFRLFEEKIKVFGGDTNHTPDYEYPMGLPLSKLHTIELWDDVEDVKEITFNYDKRAKSKSA